MRSATLKHETQNEDDTFIKTPRNFPRVRYCSVCKVDEAATLEIYDLVGRDVYVYRLQCGRRLTDVPVPPFILQQRLAKFETLIAGGILWRVFKGDWPVIPMHLMPDQWYFEPETYHHSQPYSDSFRSRELAEQAIFDILAGENARAPRGAAVPDDVKTNNRIMSRLTKAAGAAMVRIRKRGCETYHWSAIRTWKPASEGRLETVHALRSPLLPDRAGALYSLLCLSKQEGMSSFVRDAWLAALKGAFKNPVADQGRLFLALGKFAVHYLQATHFGAEYLWPLVCELYASTLDPVMSKLVGARLIARYESAVKKLDVTIPDEFLTQLLHGPDHLMINAIDLFCLDQKSDELDLPEAVHKYLLRVGYRTLTEQEKAVWNVGEAPAPVTARIIMSRLGMFWLTKARDDARQECVDLVVQKRDFSGELRKAFEREAVLLPQQMVRAVCGDAGVLER